MSTPLIDGDIVAYKAAILGGEDEWATRGLVHSIMEEWTALARGSSQPYVAVGHGTCFRKIIYPQYKANRRPEDRPPLLPLCYDVLEASYRCVAVPDLEADDVLGIMATNGKVENPIVVSTDKDLRQIPGMHCVPGADPEILTVSHGEGLYRWATQWLTGDSTDNYGGIRGIGPKKAERILGPKDEFVSALFCNVAERILRAYFEAGCSYEYCLLMGNLSRILTDEVGWVDGKVVLLDDLSDATDDPELVEWMLDTGPEDPTDPTGAFDEEEVAA